MTLTAAVTVNVNVTVGVDAIIMCTSFTKM